MGMVQTEPLSFKNTLRSLYFTIDANSILDITWLFLVIMVRSKAIGTAKDIYEQPQVNTM